LTAPLAAVVGDVTAGWRYDAATYAAHLGIEVPSSANPTDEWAQLRALYACQRTSLREEAILDQLVSDLAAAAPSRRSP
jgi:hypothetical protein